MYCSGLLWELDHECLITFPVPPRLTIWAVVLVKMDDFWSWISRIWIWIWNPSHYLLSAVWYQSRVSLCDPCSCSWLCGEAIPYPGDDVRSISDIILQQRYYDINTIISIMISRWEIFLDLNSNPIEYFVVYLFILNWDLFIYFTILLKNIYFMYFNRP